jgi:hypothetical protein
MMKFHQLTCLGLALAGLPLLAGDGQDAPRDLRTSLGATLSLIDDLSVIQHGLASGDTAALDALLRVAPASDVPAGPQRDARVQSLRAEVHGLRARLDELDQVALEHVVDDPTLTGLTPEQRARIAFGGPTEGPAEVQAFEDENFSVDQLRQGKLLVRAGQFERAEQLLGRFPKSYEARYWLGRALAGQGRDADALDVYHGLAEDEAAGPHREWAAQDAKMLEVKRELLQRAEASR